MSDAKLVRRALLAVYDKGGVVDLARALVELGVELVSSGGTATTLRESGLPVTSVEEVTGSPEMLDGRVKTLHPKIHAGILADRRKPSHVDQLREQGIEPFDLVVVNLYPFRETVASGASPDEVIEKIDIGGPAMVRAAAKNFESVGVVVEPTRYAGVIAELREHGGLLRETRRTLAAAAFAHTAAYDAAVADWFAAFTVEGDALPAYVGLAYERIGELRYGENPHQRAALYREAATAGPLLNRLRGLAVRVSPARPTSWQGRCPQGAPSSSNTTTPAARRPRARSRTATGPRSPATKSPPSGGSSRSTARSTWTRRRRWPTSSPRS